VCGAKAAHGQASLPSGFQDELVADGLDAPVGMAFLPDGRLIVVEQNTTRVRLHAGAPRSPILEVGDVPDVTIYGERGLLGVAVDPRWPASPYLYVHYTSTDAHVHVSRFTVTGDLANTDDGSLSFESTSRYDLITDVPDIAGNHNGGTLRFGRDGMLYASFGEDANPCAAQDSVSLRGVIVRLDVSRLPAGPGAATRDLITPSDNPWVSSSNANARLVWAYGLRNPFRFQVDPATGSLVVSDVGQDQWEEVDIVDRPTLDFGWPFREGPADYPGHSTCPGVPVRPTLTEPIFAYDRSRVNNGSAVVITAGVYRPPVSATHAFPDEYVGNVFVSDCYHGYTWRLVNDGGSWTVAAPVSGQPVVEHWEEGLDYVPDYAIGPDGGLWYCKQDVGQIRRIVTAEAAPPDTTPAPAPSPEVTIGAAYPLPSAGLVRFNLDLHRTARIRISIHDARGRRVRMLVDGFERGAGPWTTAWDGYDDQRRQVHPGLFFARFDLGGDVFERRIVLVR